MGLPGDWGAGGAGVQYSFPVFEQERRRGAADHQGLSDFVLRICLLLPSCAPSFPPLQQSSPVDIATGFHTPGANFESVKKTNTNKDKL